MDLRNALLELHGGNAPEIMSTDGNNYAPFSDELYNIRMNFIEALGIDRITLDVSDNKLAEINRQLLAMSSRFRAIVRPRVRSIFDWDYDTTNDNNYAKIRMNLLEPSLLTRELIQQWFLNSLSEEERAAYNEAQGNETPIVRTVIDAFNDLMTAERERERDQRPAADQTTALATHRRQYSPQAIRERILAQLVRENRWGGNTEAVERSLRPLEEEELLRRYQSEYSARQRLIGTTVTPRGDDGEPNGPPVVLTAADVRVRALKRMVERDAIDFDSMTDEQKDQAVAELNRRIEAIQQRQPTADTNPLPSSTMVRVVPQQPIAAPAGVGGLGAVNGLPQGYNVANEAQLAQNARQVLQRQAIQYNDYDGLIPTTHRLISNGMNQVNAYTQLNLPQMPIIHPYHPDGGDTVNERVNHGVPTFSVAAAIPGGTIGNLPRGVSELLVQNNIDIGHLDVFFNAQNMPWRNTPLLLRPHPWLHPDAPHRGAYDQTANILVGLADVNGQFGQLTAVNGVQTHPDPHSGFTAYSARQMPIIGLGDLSQTHCFYSLCINPATHRAALTFHWLLNDADNTAIQQLVQNNDTLEGFLNEVVTTPALENSALNQVSVGNVQTPMQSLSFLLSERRVRILLLHVFHIIDYKKI